LQFRRAPVRAYARGDEAVEVAMKRSMIVLALVFAAGCGGDDEDRPTPAPEPTREPPATAPGVPDGGTQRGHDRGASIRVPARDSTPPTPAVELERRSSGVRATVTGTDEDGGMGRARVAIRASFSCRKGARAWTEPYVQYVPPPMIERVKVTPGTRVHTRLVRSAGLAFDPSRCHGGELHAVHGEAWADTTNASGLDATSDHVRFRWPR
jgi:hypothetical protein